MAQTLATLSMGAGIVPTITKLIKEQDESIRVINFVNDGILPAAALNNNDMSPAAFEQLMHMLMAAEIAGADALLVTCSSISEFVNDCKPFARIPVFKIDEPMILEALKRGNKIGVAATIATTLKPSMRQVQTLADKAGQKITLDSRLVTPAYEAYLRGETDLHDQLVYSAIIELCEANDAVCLAQGSMMSVVSKMPPAYRDKVLSSPALGVKRVVDYLHSIRT